MRNIKWIFVGTTRQFLKVTWAAHRTLNRWGAPMETAGNAREEQANERHAPRLLIEMFGRMALIRSFEARLSSLYTQGLIRGSSHSSMGQEAVACGGCFALKETDYVTSTHRGHGHAIAKGSDVKRMMAELLGRAAGYCRGKGGSMHIADFSIGMLGANGIVGGGIGIATGAALSSSMRRSGQVALCFFGEGAINQGVFLECGNMAALWKLPLILLCENNQFARPRALRKPPQFPICLGGPKPSGFQGSRWTGWTLPWYSTPFPSRLRAPGKARGHRLSRRFAIGMRDIFPATT